MEERKQPPLEGYRGSCVLSGKPASGWSKSMERESERSSGWTGYNGPRDPEGLGNWGSGRQAKAVGFVELSGGESSGVKDGLGVLGSLRDWHKQG